MPSFPPAALAMPQLFTHTYDIDDILVALCSPTQPGQVWLLDTQQGKVLAGDAAVAVTGAHQFLLDPLPASYVGQLRSHDQRDALSPADMAALDEILATATPADLVGHFEHGMVGGWLRERVKEAALDWLDGHNLIPPSMRHVKKLSPAYMPQPMAKKITIN